MKKFLLLLLSAATLFACSENENPAERTSTLKLGYAVQQVDQKTAQGSDTTAPQSTPKQMVITIHDEHGNPVLNGERFDLIKIGEEYYSKSILLPTGHYTLEEFMVIDSADQAIYIAPKMGSKLADFIEQPLPQSFQVEEDRDTELMVQVAPAYLGSASEFGYVSFPFEVVEPATDIKARLCGTYGEDTIKPGACYDSKECLIGKWWFQGFIDTDRCIVEIPDSVWGVTSWIVLDSTNRPWIEFFENDSLAGESVCHHNDTYIMPRYKIGENNTLQLVNFIFPDGYCAEWDSRFSSSIGGASKKFVSFNDTLFLYNKNEKMLFIKEK